MKALLANNLPPSTPRTHTHTHTHSLSSLLSLSVVRILFWELVKQKNSLYVWPTADFCSVCRSEQVKYRKLLVNTNLAQVRQLLMLQTPSHFHMATLTVVLIARAMKLSFLLPAIWYNCTGWLGIKHQVTYLTCNNDTDAGYLKHTHTHPHTHTHNYKVYTRHLTENYHSHSSGAVWESRWPSWAGRPNEPSGFHGRKAILNHASALVSACP